MINECYARGTPIVASAIGPIAEVVADRRTGLHFRPGDVDDLVAKVTGCSTIRPSRRSCATGARQEFEAKYTAESGLKQLLAAYQRAIAVRHRIPARAEATRVPS